MSWCSHEHNQWACERKLIPPSVADERGVAFGKTMARAIADPDFKRLLFERIDTVDASVLPFLIREFSIEEFIEPGMTDAVIRRLLKLSYELHATKGFIHGVRRGLLMLGMRVVWKQWFQNVPKMQAGTHVATVFVNEPLFEGQSEIFDARVQRAASRMIEGMKRASQHVSFQLGIAINSETQAAFAAAHADFLSIEADAMTNKNGIGYSAVAAVAALADQTNATLEMAIGKSAVSISRAAAGAVHLEYIQVGS